CASATSSCARMRHSSRRSCAAAPSARGCWPPRPCQTCASAWEWAPHVRAGRYREAMNVAALELDLEVFTGPFDLLLTLVLREEVDLLELELADVVLAYLDYLESSGELDLEAATEFIVLVAALLELKSRLMLLGDEDEEIVELEPEAAAEELLARMLEAHRYRAAASHLGELLAGEHGVRF